MQRKSEIITVDGSKSEIVEVAWSKRPDDLRFATLGPKEINFWHPADVTKKLSIKGTLQKAPATLLNCFTFDEEGWCYTGNENGLIYVWSNDCVVVKTIKAHSSTVTAISSDGNKLISGSKDKIAIVSIATGGVYKLEKLIDLGVILNLNLPLVVPKSVDFFNGNLLVGLRNGTIIDL